jgi:hypothetical protein
MPSFAYFVLFSLDDCLIVGRNMWHLHIGNIILLTIVLSLTLYNYIAQQDVPSKDSKQEIITSLLAYWACPFPPHSPRLSYFVHNFDPISTCYSVESRINFQYQTHDFPIHVPVNLSTHLQSP